jgi:hypothetical protein
MPESQQNIHSQKVKLPEHPIISDCSVKSVAQRDTLDRVVSIIALLQELELSDGISVKAENGLYWILATLKTTIQHVSETLAADDEAG